MSGDLCRIDGGEMNRLNLWPARRVKKYSFVWATLFIVGVCLVMNIRVVHFGRDLDREFRDLTVELDRLESRVNQFVRRNVLIPDAADISKRVEQVSTSLEDVNSVIVSQAFSFSRFSEAMENILPQEIRLTDLQFQEKDGEHHCTCTGLARSVEDMTKFLNLLSIDPLFKDPFLYFHREEKDEKSRSRKVETRFKIGFSIKPKEVF